jgi:hypothetical protein
MYFQVHAGLSSLSLSLVVMRAASSQSRSLIRFDFFCAGTTSWHNSGSFITAKAFAD